MTQPHPAAPSASIHRPLTGYLEVLKPRETAMITFIGVATAVVASGGGLSLEMLLVTVATIAIGSGGVNGLTNYLDREVDGRMERTRGRALPSRRIRPTAMVVPYAGGLTALGLLLAWLLNPWAAVVGLVGTVASLVGRKSGFTHLLGGLAGAAPVLVG
ncbi:MAG: UbiA family prenyltransferase, partial [Dehalococcoidia bacterium]|nr:UbiA family prenyltransferase [Dehalococcoidia bacterium]